jgi:hypothetical protein
MVRLFRRPRESATCRWCEGIVGRARHSLLTLAEAGGPVWIPAFAGMSGKRDMRDRPYYLIGAGYAADSSPRSFIARSIGRAERRTISRVLGPV